MISSLNKHIRAGYSKKTAYSIGEENLRKPEIQKAIEAGVLEARQRAQTTLDDILNELDENRRYALMHYNPQNSKAGSILP